LSAIFPTSFPLWSDFAHGTEKTVRAIGERVIDGLQKRCAADSGEFFKENQSRERRWQTKRLWLLRTAARFLGLAAALVLLDAVEMSDLTQDPSTMLRGLLARLVKVALRMSRASG
jgi:hypothetical protein